MSPLIVSLSILLFLLGWDSTRWSSTMKSESMDAIIVQMLNITLLLRNAKIIGSIRTFLRGHRVFSWLNVHHRRSFVFFSFLSVHQRSTDRWLWSLPYKGDKYQWFGLAVYKYPEPKSGCLRDANNRRYDWLTRRADSQGMERRCLTSFFGNVSLEDISLYLQ